MNNPILSIDTYYDGHLFRSRLGFNSTMVRLKAKYIFDIMMARSEVAEMYKNIGWVGDGKTL